MKIRGPTWSSWLWRLTLSSLSVTLSSPFSSRACSFRSSSRSFRRRVSAFSTACTAGVSSAITSATAQKDTLFWGGGRMRERMVWLFFYLKKGQSVKRLQVSPPCSHSKTSMLGGMLSALLAICFSNVVFPLLCKDGEREKEIKQTRWSSITNAQGNVEKVNGWEDVPIWSNQAISSSCDNQEVSVDKQLFSMSRYAEPFQLRKRNKTTM